MTFLPKKGMGALMGEQQQKAPSPPLPPHHGAKKGLMMGKAPVAPSPVQRLVTHKDYVVDMVTSIIKETDLDPYGEHFSEDLGACGLYDLSRVRAAHPNLDLSQIVIGDTVSPMLGGDDTISNETVDSIHKVKQETCRLEKAEKAKTNLVTELAVLFSSAKNSTTVEGLPVVNPVVVDAPSS
nr:hypothetical protein CFP56_38670 [Quercus suber]